MLHKTKIGLLTAAMLVLLVLAACGATESTVEPAANPDTAAVETMPTDGAMADDTMKDDSAMADDAMADDTMKDDSAMADDAMADDTMKDDSAMADDAMADDTMKEDGTTAEDAAMVENVADRPAWQQIALTDAVTGAPFTFADFAGRTVLVEPMATWCTNCRQQLRNVRDARARLGEDFVFVALSLETNLSNAALAEYAVANGFEWTFAVMTPELLQLLADQFGRTITNAPSTPHFVIYPDGSFSDLATGIKPADALVAQLTATP
jgi:cytochrome oxidase Cu insertion factor (SCO1/SenC/PrrC family)